MRPEVKRFTRPPLVDDLGAQMRLAVAAWNGGADDRDGLRTERVRKERSRLRKTWGWGEILVESEAQLDRLAERRRTVQDLRRVERAGSRHGRARGGAGLGGAGIGSVDPGAAPAACTRSRLRGRLRARWPAPVDSQ